MKKLTKNQQEFADNYIKNGNASEAYRKAGYKAKSATVIRANASRLLTNANVKKYIEERMKQIASDKIMGVTEAVQLLSSIARGEVTETKVIDTQYGADTVDVPPDLKTRISAIKEILKRHPNDDTMLKVQLRKINAEAKFAEVKAKDMVKSDDSQMKAIGGLLDKIEGDVAKNDDQT